MFKLGSAPTPTADTNDHADFLELDCLRQGDGTSSGGDLAAVFSRLNDDLPEDRADADTVMEESVRDAFSEIADRISHSNGGVYRYPFRINRSGDLLRFDRRNARSDLYLFLLTATRVNMGEDRVHDGIDGADLFEQVCCEVAKNYWGANAAGIVFGTARRVDGREVSGFEQAVNDLCQQLGEGVGFSANYGDTVTAQDGKLDVVVWKPFSDQRRGQLIGFGQCKTGTNWASGLFNLQPDGFCKKWVRAQPVVDPIRLYFITSRVKQAKWNETCVDAGIVFDRCRILNYAPAMPELRDRWRRWTSAALQAHGVTWS